MKEHELKKAIEALIVSRVMYPAPYMHITKTQRNTVETQLRKATRLAVGVPIYTSLKAINRTGFIKTLEDRIELHIQAQYQRLTTSHQGRNIIREAKYTTTQLPSVPPSPRVWPTVG